MRRSVRIGLLIAGILLLGGGFLADDLGFSGSVPIQPTEVSSEEGNAFIVPDPIEVPFPFVVRSDEPDAPRRSRVELFENGNPLGPAHADHHSVREIGQGRYSHWDGWIRFSTSDNSDPRTNKRAYSASYVAEPWLPPSIVSATGFLLLSVVFFRPMVQRFGARRNLGSVVRYGRRAAIILVANIVLFLALIPVGEAFLRIYFYGTINTSSLPVGFMVAHPTRGWALSPNSVQEWTNLDYSVVSRTNSRGFRDRERKHEKPDGKKRIVILGDSFMEGYYVEYEKSLPVLLEKSLKDRRVEVINLGVRGYGTVQEHITLEEEGVAYSPDLVLLFFAMNNDISNDSREWRERLLLAPLRNDVLPPYLEPDENGKWRYIFPDYEANAESIRKNGEAVREISESRSFLDRLLLWELARSLFAPDDAVSVEDPTRRPTVVLPYDPNVTFGDIVTNFDPKLRGGAFLESDYRDLRRRAWEISCKSLSRAKSIARSAGSAFAVVTVPSIFQADPLVRAELARTYPTLSFDPAEPSRELAACAAEEGFLVLDLFPVFSAAAADGTPFYHQYADRHWNPRGVALAADAVDAWLRGVGRDLLHGG